MEKISNEKRREILDAALDLFSERGFDRTTVDEIASKAKVGKGTIYLYFQNKEQIFLAIIEDGLTNLYQQLLLVLELTDFREQINSFIKTHLTFVENNQNFYHIFLKERTNLRIMPNETTQCGLKELHFQIYRIMTNFISKGMEQGLIRQGNPEDFATALSGILINFSFHWILTGAPDSLAAKAPDIANIYLAGVENRVKIS